MDTAEGRAASARRHLSARSRPRRERREENAIAEQIVFTARILLKRPKLPRYVVVAPEHLDGRTACFPAAVSLNGAPAFARTIRPWGKGANVFFNLTEPQCRTAAVDTGDLCEVRLTTAD